MPTPKLATNNKNFSCPAQMSDGRIFTDYGPNCELNNNIQSDHNIKNSYVYRQYLIQNGTALINKNRTLNATKNGCAGCNNPEKDTTMSGMPNNNDAGNTFAHINTKELDSSVPAPFNI